VVTSVKDPETLDELKEQNEQTFHGAWICGTMVMIAQAFSHARRHAVVVNVDHHRPLNGIAYELDQIKV